MKLLTAIIRPEKLEAVEAVLQPLEACLVSIGPVMGYSVEQADQLVYRGAIHQMQPSRLRLEITVEDSRVDELVDAIACFGASQGAGRLSDGAIFVTPLIDCVRIGAVERSAPPAAHCIQS